jgi:hypothetical protein
MVVRTDITIVTAGRADVLAAWVEAFKRSPNFGKFRVRVGDDGFPAEFRKTVEDAGFELFDMTEIRKRSVEIFHKQTVHHAMWYSKVDAMLRGTKTRFCLWLDHDAEVRGDLEPIIDYGLSLGKWMCAPKYASMPPKRYAGQRVTQNGMVLLDISDALVATWRQVMLVRHDPNDETALPFVLGGFDKADASIGDLYRPEWYASVDCYSVVHQSLYVANELLKTNKDAAVRHWCAPCGKRTFMGMFKEGAEK